MQLSQVIVFPLLSILLLPHHENAISHRSHGHRCRRLSCCCAFFSCASTRSTNTGWCRQRLASPRRLADCARWVQVRYYPRVLGRNSIEEIYESGATLSDISTVRRPASLSLSLHSVRRIPQRHPRCPPASSISEPSSGVGTGTAITRTECRGDVRAPRALVRRWRISLNIDRPS
jgi:hypothetical protein